MPNARHVLAGEIARTHIAVSRVFDIDNGNGTTVDDAFLYLPYASTIRSAFVLYTTATAGTVAAATISLGTTVGGVDLVAATALVNAKTVGSVTALTLAASAVPASTMISARHTGIASTVAGEYRVVVTYTIDD